MQGPIDAKLAGRYVRLRAIEASDYGDLRRAETASELAFRWRLAGQSIPPEQYPSSLWNGVLAAFIYESITPSPGYGIINAYGADPRHGFAYVAAGALRSFGGSLRSAVCSCEAIALFIDYLFAGWNLRKLYFDVAEFNAPQFASFLDRCEREAALSRHLYLDGRFWDLYSFALWRDQWPSLRAVLHEADDVA